MKNSLKKRRGGKRRRGFLLGRTQLIIYYINVKFMNAACDCNSVKIYVCKSENSLSLSLSLSFAHLHADACAEMTTVS